VTGRAGLDILRGVLDRTAIAWMCLLGCRPAPSQPPPPQASAPAPATAKPAATADAEPTQDGLDRESIRSVVRAHIEEVRECYTRGLAIDATLQGRVVVQFTIKESGAVVSAWLLQSTLPASGAAVAPCIVERARTWMFPPHSQAEYLVITYPFVLEPAE
jgi:hypothetical protein